MNDESDIIEALKAQRNELDSQVEAAYEAFYAAGVAPNEPPASNIVVGTLIEILFGDEDDPQRITFDMRLAANRLKIMAGQDPAQIRAEADARTRFAHGPGKRRRRRK